MAITREHALKAIHLAIEHLNPFGPPTTTPIAQDNQHANILLHEAINAFAGGNYAEAACDARVSVLYSVGSGHTDYLILGREYDSLAGYTPAGSLVIGPPLQFSAAPGTFDDILDSDDDHYDTNPNIQLSDN